MVKYKVTTGHDGKWYVFNKMNIMGTAEFRWVAQSKPCDSRSEAYAELPAGEMADDTITLIN